MELRRDFHLVVAVLRAQPLALDIHCPLVVRVPADDDIGVGGPRRDAADAERVHRHQAAAARAVEILHVQRVDLRAVLHAELDPAAVSARVHAVPACRRHPLAQPLGEVGLLVLEHARLVVATTDHHEVPRERPVEVGRVTHQRVEVVVGESVLGPRNAVLRASRICPAAHRAEQVADINDASAARLRLAQVLQFERVVGVRVVVVPIARQQEPPLVLHAPDVHVHDMDVPRPLLHAERRFSRARRPRRLLRRHPSSHRHLRTGRAR